MGDDSPIAYDAMTRLFTMADGTKITEDAYRRRIPNQGVIDTSDPKHPIRMAARQGFTPTPPGQPRLGTPHSRIKDSRELRHVLSRFMGTGVVVFTSGHRFTYAAIGVSQTGRWYITGKGEFYGKNEFEFNEFIDDVLMRDEVTTIWASDRFDQVYGT